MDLYFSYLCSSNDFFFVVVAIYFVYITTVIYDCLFKSYRSFHEDLFPETFAPDPSLTSSEWFAGKTAQVCVFISQI